MKKIIILIITTVFLLSSFKISASSLNYEKNKFQVDEEYDLVIISPDVFSSDFQLLIDHKNSLNVRTILKTTEDIYDGFNGRDQPEQIKYFIKYAIETWNIGYVMLVGGAELLPARITNVYYQYDYKTYWNFLSDLYYADIYDQNNNFCSWDSNNNDLFAEYDWDGETDELDFKPDVYLGRLPCVNQDEVLICIDKIINYENQVSYEQEWFKNLVLIGGDSLPGDSEHVDEGEYVNQQVMEIMDGFNPVKIWASNHELFSSSNIDDAINDGAGFVFFNGHGNLDMWATHPHENNNWIPNDGYDNSNLLGLNNGYSLPIVISDACYHCTYNVKPDCFGWTFVTNPNGGCIAFLGGIDIDISYGGVDIITKGIEKLCIEMSSNYIQGDSTLGELWGNGLTDYYQEPLDEIDILTLEEFHLFGDPSLKIAKGSQPPEKPSRPTGPAKGNLGKSYMYSSYSNDPEQDNIYYKFDWGDGTDSGWLGPYNSGVIVEANHSWEEKGSYCVRVIAKDENNKYSQWSDPLTVSMPKNIIKNQLIQRTSLLFQTFLQKF